MLARRAEFAEAEALAREALVIAEATDFVTDRADALATCRTCSGPRAGATRRSRLRPATYFYELKGNAVAAAATWQRLGELDSRLRG